MTTTTEIRSRSITGLGVNQGSFHKERERGQNKITWISVLMVVITIFSRSNHMARSHCTTPLLKPTDSLKAVIKSDRGKVKAAGYLLI